MIKVLLVEDHQMVRMGLEIILEKSTNIKLIAQADNGRDGVDLALKLKPDVILVG